MYTEQEIMIWGRSKSYHEFRENIERRFKIEFCTCLIQVNIGSEIGHRIGYGIAIMYVCMLMFSMFYVKSILVHFSNVLSYELVQRFYACIIQLLYHFITCPWQ